MIREGNCHRKREIKKDQSDEALAFGVGGGGYDFCLILGFRLIVYSIFVLLKPMSKFSLWNGSQFVHHADAPFASIGFFQPICISILLCVPVFPKGLCLLQTLDPPLVKYLAKHVRWRIPTAITKGFILSSLRLQTECGNVTLIFLEFA